MGFSLGGALSGAAGGFMAGGPWGAAIGGAAGGFLGGKKKRLPRSPDPNAVAQQQIGVGQQVQGLNAPNQTGLFAGTQYERNAAGGITGVKTALTPEMQGIYDSLRSGIGTRPGDVSDAVYGQYTSRLDPQFQQADESMRTRLANQGLTPGSEAYTREIDQFGRQRNDAYAGARRDATAAGGAEQSRLLQGIYGLGGASGAGYQDTPQMATPNVGEYVYKNFGAQQDAYNQSVGSNNAMMSGLFNLGAAAIGARGRK